MPKARQHLIDMALSSYKELGGIINELTLQETEQALALEADSRRRKAIVCRLFRRLIRLKELETREHYIRKYFNGENPICDYE